MAEPPVRARALLVDLDDTLYDYVPAEAAGRSAVLGKVCIDLGLAPEVAQDAWNAARHAVKLRLGERGSSHSRLLYLLELVHAVGRVDKLDRVRAWERTFWSAFLAASTLRPGARPLFDGFRRAGGKVAIVTDLVVDVQLWKLDALGLTDAIDALVVSEEVKDNKPATEAFLLAAKRLGVPIETCAVLGDSARKDGGGARALGLPFYHVRGSETDSEGMSLEDVAAALGLTA